MYIVSRTLITMAFVNLLGLKGKVMNIKKLTILASGASSPPISINLSGGDA